jgi:hypothetical protein
MLRRREAPVPVFNGHKPSPLVKTSEENDRRVVVGMFAYGVACSLSAVGHWLLVTAS